MSGKTFGYLGFGVWGLQSRSGLLRSGFRVLSLSLRDGTWEKPRIATSKPCNTP